MIVSAFAAALLAAAPAPQVRPCLTTWNSSTTHYHPVDDHTIIIEDGRRWYRLEVTPTSQLTDAGSVIISQVRGSSQMCSPIDFQLSVDTPPGGFPVGMIAQSFAPIPEAEGKALVRKAAR